MTDLVVDEQLVTLVDEQLEVQLLETGDPVQVITDAAQGPPGPAGPAGEPGPAGPAGPAVVGRAEQYVHTQDSPSALWHILHNRGARPSVTVLDIDGNAVLAGVRHEDATQLYIEFSMPFRGTAILI